MKEIEENKKIKIILIAIISILVIILGIEAFFILKDTNYVSIKGTPEYSTNLNSKTPTNRILTSLFHKSRILNFIKFFYCFF